MADEFSQLVVNMCTKGLTTDDITKNIKSHLLDANNECSL